MTARRPMLESLVTTLTERDVLVSCLGANARYLPHLPVPCPVFALCDSMGVAVPLALGIALERPDRHVVALEGDGSLLMSPNVLTTAAAAAPANLTVLLWINGRYESSGGQALPRVAIDWPALARAQGIRHVASVDDPAGLREAVTRARGAGAPALIVVEIAFDPAEAIPPYSERPEEIRARFRL